MRLFPTHQKIKMTIDRQKIYKATKILTKKQRILKLKETIASLEEESDSKYERYLKRLREQLEELIK